MISFEIVGTSASTLAVSIESILLVNVALYFDCLVKEEQMPRVSVERDLAHLAELVSGGLLFHKLDFQVIFQDRLKKHLRQLSEHRITCELLIYKQSMCNIVKYSKP